VAAAGQREWLLSIVSYRKLLPKPDFFPLIHIIAPSTPWEESVMIILRYHVFTVILIKVQISLESI